MPGLHLNHHVCWDDLLELCYIYEDPGIKLPICECDRIAASNKKVQHQIKNRKYLDDKICTSENCKIVGEKMFRKTEKRKLEIPGNLRRLERNPDKPNVSRFVDKFCAAIKEFAETERKKIKDRNIVDSNELEKYCNDIEKRLRDEGKWDFEFEWWSRNYGCHDSCKLFFIFIETGDSATLLSMPNEMIEKVLRCTKADEYEAYYNYSYRFFAHHIIEVYLCTNLIIAAGLQDKPEQWGPMKPDKRIFNYCGQLMKEGDGQIFLYGCRKYLTDEIYMKDFDAMKEMCKKCFQLFYFLEMLSNEIGVESNFLLY